MSERARPESHPAAQDDGNACSLCGGAGVVNEWRPDGDVEGVAVHFGAVGKKP